MQFGAVTSLDFASEKPHYLAVTSSTRVSFIRGHRLITPVKAFEQATEAFIRVNLLFAGHNI